VLLDIKMPKKDGMEVLEGMREAGKETPVVVLSGHGSIETAVEAVKKGAFDYVSKPPDLNRILDYCKKCHGEILFGDRN
jgi:two-component system nitrogen regulation response regulator NtrX